MLHQKAELLTGFRNLEGMGLCKLLKFKRSALYLFWLDGEC